MEVCNFRNCCGAVEVGNFGWDIDLNPHQLLSNLESARLRNKGLAIATTVRSQKRAVVLLKEHGFKVLRRFRNPNTGALVTLWGKVLT